MALNASFNLQATTMNPNISRNNFVANHPKASAFLATHPVANARFMANHPNIRADIQVNRPNFPIYQRKDFMAINPNLIQQNPQVLRPAVDPRLFQPQPRFPMYPQPRPMYPVYPQPQPTVNPADAQMSKWLKVGAISAASGGVLGTAGYFIGKSSGKAVLGAALGGTVGALIPVAISAFMASKN